MHCLWTEFKFCACTVFKNHLIVYFRTYIQENPYFNISFCLIFSKNLFLNPLCHFFQTMDQPSAPKMDDDLLPSAPDMEENSSNENQNPGNKSQKL